MIYFADDDNTYDIRLFTEIRKTQKVSMFPVGLVSGSPVSTPIVQEDQLLGFYLGWEGNRKFPLDMAGFAFTLSHYRKVCQYGMVSMPYIKGYEEDGFLKQLQVSRQSMEILTPDKVKYQRQFRMELICICISDFGLAYQNFQDRIQTIQNHF